MYKYNEIQITKDDLKKIINFILMKFRSDPLHFQGTSAKRDLIGGYIERWFNKIAETVVFDDLFRGKEYKVVSDYFLYGNDSDKNAPDILGLKTSSGLNIPFSKYNNGTWISIDGMPKIEVKVVRQDQSLLGVREPQMGDDYYVFIESNLEGDYLTAIFEDAVFDDKYFHELEMSEDYILRDENSQILPHRKMRKNEKIGSMRLIGIYTRNELRKNTVLCSKDISPFYFSDATNAERVIKAQNDSGCLAIGGNGKIAYGIPGQDDIYLPFSITTTNGEIPEVKILKRNKGSLYIESDRELVIDNIKTKPGIVKIGFKEFERSSAWDENVSSKLMLERYGVDSTEELITIFDKITQTT